MSPTLRLQCSCSALQVESHQNLDFVKFWWLHFTFTSLALYFHMPSLKLNEAAPQCSRCMTLTLHHLSVFEHRCKQLAWSSTSSRGKTAPGNVSCSPAAAQPGYFPHLSLDHVWPQRSAFARTKAGSGHGIIALVGAPPQGQTPVLLNSSSSSPGLLK